MRSPSKVERLFGEKCLFNCCLLNSSAFMSLLFNTEDECDMCLGNMDSIWTDFTTLYSCLHKPSMKVLRLTFPLPFKQLWTLLLLSFSQSSCFACSFLLYFLPSPTLGLFSLMGPTNRASIYVFRKVQLSYIFSFPLIAHSTSVN
jgi:hypothetical protein